MQKCPIHAVEQSDGTVLPGTNEVRSQMREARRQKLQTRNWEPETNNQRGAEHLNEPRILGGPPSDSRRAAGMVR